MTTDFEVGSWSIQILSECCSGCGACYGSQKASKIKKNEGKSGVNRSEDFKVLCTCSRNTPTRSSATQQSRSVEQLTDNVHLATSARSICVFSIGGIPQSIVHLHTLINLVVPVKFFIIFFTFMLDIKWPKQLGEIKMTCCKVCHGQLGRSLSDVTSASRGSQNQPIRRNQKHRSVPELSFSGRKLRSFGVLENCVWPSNKSSMKDLEALWSF